MKKKSLILVLLPVIAVILELLPYGAVLRFANPEGEPYVHTYAYFSMTPFGYANFGPLLTAILTCILLVLAVVFIFKKSDKLVKSMKIMNGIAVATSLMPLMFGFAYVSLVGALITIVLLLELWLVLKKI